MHTLLYRLERVELIKFTAVYGVRVRISKNIEMYKTLFASPRLRD